MTSFSANVFFFMYACGKRVSASAPNLFQRHSNYSYSSLKLQAGGGDKVPNPKKQFDFAPLDFSSTYGSTLSLNAASSYEPDFSPNVMLTSHCISPIPRWKPRRRPKRFAGPRCYNCKRPGHFAYNCSRKS